jgi:hypothetical protein
VADDDYTDDPATLGPMILLPDESILQEWLAPGGRGLLTNLRCVLLGHPHPLHRRMHWTIELEKVKSLEVEEVTARLGKVTVLEPKAEGFGTREELDPVFGVMVNGIVVYVGEPAGCSSLQARVDDARTRRCISVYGRLIPFQPGPPKRPGDAPDGAPFPVAPPATPVALGAPFVLFIAGEPRRDALAGQSSQALVGVVPVAGATVVTLGSAHEPSDLLPGQIFGREANEARYVLAVAGRCGARVKLVDVDHPGEDLALLQSAITEEDVLPCLVRADGQRLSGEEALSPAHLAAFLRGAGTA